MDVKLELQAELFQRYPLTFRQPGMRLNSDPGEEPYLENDEGPIDHYGIECGDGWLPIIDRIADLCEREIRSMRVRRVPREIWPRCVQAKEKFGLIRIYIHGHLSEEIRTAINAAEEQSGKVCEACGAPAELAQDRGYWLTLCPSCTAAPKGDPVVEDTDYDRYLLEIRALLETRLK